MLYSHIFINEARRGGKIPEPVPGLKKKFLNLSQTRLLKLNPIPLRAGRGGFGYCPAPLPSLLGLRVFILPFFFSFKKCFSSEIDHLRYVWRSVGTLNGI